MWTRLFRPALALGAVALAAFPGCSMLEGQSDGGAVPDPSLTTQSAEPGKVMVRGTAFNPADVTAAVGQDVTWTINDGGLAHTVTADDGSFDSGQLSEGEFKHAFPRAGEYQYHCEVHARMRGKVRVS